MSKIWLVTGCSRGVGRALVETLVEGGERVVVTARSVADLSFLAPSERVRKVALDVTDAAAAKSAVKEAVAAFGRLDVLVNNAGFAQANSIEDEREADFRKQFEINFFGAYNLVHAALPVMRAQSEGSIVLVSSIGARARTPGLGAYQAAKAGVSALAEVLAKEVGPLGIRVTAVEPGGIRTDMFSDAMLSKSLRADYEPTVGATIRGVFGNPEAATNDPKKVASAIVRLASEKEPPARVLLGADALHYAGLVLAETAKSDEDWSALSRSTTIG